MSNPALFVLSMMAAAVVSAIAMIVGYNVWSTNKSDEAYSACLKANQKIAEMNVQRGSVSYSLPTCWRR